MAGTNRAPDTAVPAQVCSPGSNQFLISLAFFSSGAAALLFETVWLYRCSLLLGQTVWAVTTVLSAFMAGLGLGNLLVAFCGDRLRRELTIYALLEGVAAAGGLGLTYLLTVLPNALGPVLGGLVDAGWTVHIIRGGIAFAMLAVPTTAIGATLPLLVSALSRTDTFGPVLGRLYGINTVGGVLGVLASELVLFEWLGTNGTAWVAALLSATASVTALSVRGRFESPVAIGPGEPATSRSIVIPAPATWRFLSAAALMGTALMGLEVIWFRFLSMFAVASTLASSVVLACVLASIAVGSFIGASWLRYRPTGFNCFTAVAFAASSSLVIGYRLCAWAGIRWTAEWYRILWASALLTSMTALFSGIAFVLLGSALARRLTGARMSAAGWLTLSNTLGGAVGPVIAGFVLLPRIGVERSLFVFAAVYAVAGALGADTSLGRTRTRAAFVSIGSAALMLLGLASFPFGSMDATYIPQVTATYASDGSQIVATREGLSENIQLMEKSWLGKALYYRLVTNGFSMSGTHTSAKRYMGLFAFLPALIHDTPIKRVLVICYGAGVTASAVSAIPGVDSVDIAEISPDVVAMSDIIYRGGQNPLHDRRVRLHLEDGRYFLQATPEHFDVITGEPPPPLTPGTVSLYTREYFELVRDRLSEGGVATYWLPVARRGEYDVRAIVAAFCDAFDDCSLWNGTVFDWMLMGTRRATGPVQTDRFAGLWNDPTALPKLREAGFEVPQQIAATFLGDAHDLQELAAGAAPVSDDYPKRLRPEPARLDRSADLTESERSASAFVSSVVDTDRARVAFERSPLVHRLWPSSFITETIPYFHVQSAINRILWEGPRPLARIEELHSLLADTSLRRAPLWALGSDDAQQESVDDQADASGTSEYVLGIRALVARQYGAAAEFFAEAQQRGLELPTIRPLMAYALCLANQMDVARQLIPRSEPENPDEAHFWRWLQTTFILATDSNMP